MRESRDASVPLDDVIIVWKEFSVTTQTHFLTGYCQMGHTGRLFHTRAHRMRHYGVWLMFEPCSWTHPVGADCNWGWRRTFSVWCKCKLPPTRGGHRGKRPFHGVSAPLMVMGLINIGVKDGSYQKELGKGSTEMGGVKKFVRLGVG